MAEAPTSTSFLSFAGYPLSQDPNQWGKHGPPDSIGHGLMPKVKYTARQTNFARWHSKNKCWMFSSLLQKQHFPSPFHFLLSKLSLVRITPFLRYHKKILIFIGSLNFQAIQSSCALCSFTRFVYIDLTEKIEFWFAFQTKDIVPPLSSHELARNKFIPFSHSIPHWGSSIRNIQRRIGTRLS